MAEPRALVAVLAGGRARRLGGGKAGACLGGRPLIEYPLLAARAAGLEAVVVAKPESPLPPLSVPVLREPERPSHPLCGVIRALEFGAVASGERGVILLGCDMPFLTGELLRWLAGLSGVAMAEVGGRPQPLLCRCPASGAEELRAALAAGRSLSGALAGLSPQILGEDRLGRFGDPARLCFNVNTPEDLLEARRLLDQAPAAGPGSPPPTRPAASRS